MVEVEIGEDQLVLDRLPDDAGHLVAVEIDDRVGDFVATLILAMREAPAARKVCAGLIA